MNSRNPTPFIVLEGIDGAGTTTQCQRLATRLQAQGRRVHTTHEPSDQPIGRLLREALTHKLALGGEQQAATMALLFAADRLDHVAKDVVPHQRAGAVVIGDRYDLSSIVYQTATAAEGEDPATVTAWIQQLNRYAPRPDVTLLIEVDPDVAAQRREQRSGTPELYEKLELQRKLAALYRRAQELLPDDRLIRIDGNGPADKVEEAVWQALQPWFQSLA